MFNEASVVWRYAYQSIFSAFLQLCWRPLLYTSITAYWSQCKTRFSRRTNRMHMSHYNFTVQLSLLYSSASYAKQRMPVFCF